PFHAVFKEHLGTDAVQYPTDRVQNCRMCSRPIYCRFIKDRTVLPEGVPGCDAFSPFRSCQKILRQDISYSKTDGPILIHLLLEFGGPFEGREDVVFQQIPKSPKGAIPRFNIFGLDNIPQKAGEF
ncbi:DUF4348 domain-containing protein, partial [Dysosmobacter welbionis]